MTYPKAFQDRIDALAKALASEGVAWDPERSDLIRVRHDAQPSFAVESSARSLLEDLRRWYENASRPLVAAFVAETRGLARALEPDDPDRNALMALAARAADQNCRLIEERALLSAPFQEDPLVPQVDWGDAAIDVPPARELASADWRQGERDLLALARLQLHFERGALHPAANQELVASVELLRRAVETWEEETSTPLPVERQLTGISELDEASQDELQATFDTLQGIVHRVTEAEEYQAFTAPLLGVLGLLRGAAGLEIDLAAIDFAQVLAAWQQSGDPEQEAAAADLDIRLAAWNRHPERAREEWRRCQQGAPLEPLGWRESVAHVREQLAEAGILWHPRREPLRYRPGACVPESLVRDVTVLLVRSRVWRVQATSLVDVDAFVAQMRRQARTWRDQTREIAWREGAAECERLALRAERLACELPEAWAWVQARVTGRWPSVQPSNEPETSMQAEEENLSLEDAHLGLWRLATALRRGDLRTTPRARTGAS